MGPDHRRRQLVGLLTASAAATLTGFQALAAPSKAPLAVDQLRELERQSGGRLGIAALDTGTQQRIGYRADERFALCSTFKLFLSAAVLERARTPSKWASLEALLAHRIRFDSRVLVAHSPIAERHLDTGMTVGELCDATIRYSDNAAANLLLDLIGGPSAVTKYMRGLGDKITRLDRIEPALNSAIPGDPRDTTTPAAALQSLDRILLRADYPSKEQALLKDWMVRNTTGDTRVRAGTPAGWVVGDKTGTGARGATNDIAVLWPPGRAPIVLTAYSDGAKGSLDERNATLAAATRIVVGAFDIKVPRT
jgi:beta-lactamase class A